MGHRYDLVSITVDRDMMAVVVLNPVALVVTQRVRALGFVWSDNADAGSVVADLQASVNLIRCLVVRGQSQSEVGL
jgi:hypothetical protein